jgi:hypothetical protein
LNFTISDKFAKIDEQINELIQEKVAFENAKAIESSNEHLDEVIKDLRNEEDCSSILANLSLMVVLISLRF